MSSRPALSVLMPVRNGERFVAAAIESVLAQTLRELELLVLDDGSTDSTPAILERIAARDPRVSIHRQGPGRNVAEAINTLAGLSRAPLIARLDADDLALPDRLQNQAEALAADPGLSLLGGQALLVDEQGREFGKAEYPCDNNGIREALRGGNAFVHSAVTMRREAFEAVGGYRVNFDHAEDLDLWLRLADHHRIENLPSVVVKYRIHGTQLSLGKQDEQAMFAAAAHASARARSAGEPDPFAAVDPIDEAFVLSHGVTKGELTASIVDSTAWLGRTTGRAGHQRASRKLLSAAYDRARSESGTPALVASVHRSAAQLHAEQGHRVRAKLKTAQARLAERGSPR